jgi:hypothetical protein
MKTAVVITGHMRCWKQLYPYFKEKFISKYNPDIYISTWDTEGWWQWGDFYRNSPSINDQEIFEAYNPKKYLKEVNSSYDEFFSSLASKYTKTYGPYIKNVISMMYKWKSGLDLIEEDYDLVIRTRTDVEYLEAFPEFNTEYFYSAEQPGIDQGGMGDMMHAGSLKDMKAFCNIFNELDNLYAQIDMFCPHLLTEQYSKNLNFKWIEFKNLYKLHNTPWGQHQEVQRFMK